MEKNLHALALRCLAHLEKEDAMLQDAWSIVNAFRQALRERTPDQLQLLMNHQQQSDRISANLSTSREELRRELSVALRIPVELVSIAALIDRCDGPIREGLQQQQRRLMATAENINRLNQANAMLAAQLIELMQGLLRRLTGVESGPTRYAANGRIAIPPLP